jgi:predicted ribosomally synthesized peptide with SipW-like signal peptide
MNKRGIITRALWALLLVGAMAGLLMVGVTAIFTDQSTNPANAFTAGTLDLAISPVTAMFTVSPMAPGDVVYSGLQVTNSGNLAMRYAMTTTPDNGSILDEQLDLTTDLVTAAGVDGIWYTADDVVGTANVIGPDGVLSAAAIGNPAQGAQAGDRTLAAGSNERLRYKVTLPLGTGNGYQGTTATVALVFDAEQTANNP